MVAGYPIESIVQIQEKSLKGGCETWKFRNHFAEGISTFSFV